MKKAHFFSDTGGRRSIAAGISLIAVLALFSSGLFSTGCATVKPGQDATIVNAERDEAIAFDTIDAFLKIEVQNRAEFQKLVPGVTAAADAIRVHAPDAFHAVDRAIDAYKKAKLAGGVEVLNQATTDLQAQLAAVASLLQSAQHYLSAWNGAHPAHSMRILVPNDRGAPLSYPAGGAPFLVGAIAFGSVAPWIIQILAMIAGMVGGPAAGGLAGSLATSLLDLINKIHADASQDSELSDEQLAAIRAARDKAFAEYPEWQPSTEAPAPPADGQ